MSVPRITFGPNGPVAPSEADIRTGVFNDIDTAFGGGLNPDPTTPQGNLADIIAAMLGGVNDDFLYYVNQVDPAYASGRMQDGIARIYFLSRLAALATVVSATCTGASGTVIPAGSLAQAADGTIYASLSLATIPVGGSVTVSFQAQTTGPIACPAGTLNRIYRAVPGWDSITNPADGLPGRDVESRAAFELRRSESVAANATGILAAIRGAVLSVADVVDAYATENPAATSATIGGVSVAAHSLYVSVLGGTDADVAHAIWTKKAPGCNYTGTTTVTVSDMSYPLPYPTYTVKFTRPAAVPIYFAVEIANSSLVPADATDQITAAIVATFNGDGPDGLRERIGSTVFASRYYAPVANLGTWARIIGIKVGTSASPTGDDVTVDIDEYPSIDAAHIDVAYT